MSGAGLRVVRRKACRGRGTARIPLLALVTILVACVSTGEPTARPSPAKTAGTVSTETTVSTVTSVVTPSPLPSRTPTQSPAPEPTATPVPSPTGAAVSTSLSDLIRPVVRADEEAFAGDRRLHASPDGSLWLASDRSIARLEDEAWRWHLIDFSGQLAGIDALGRVWVVSDDTTHIDVWDGASWTSYGAGHGWLPVPRQSGSPRVDWGDSDSSGRCALGTSQDVRVFDGKRWTVFSREEMGMAPPLDDHLVSVFEVRVSNGDEVWVGECEGTAGPIGGQGVRWFDGQTWHGARSPVGTGCATALLVRDSAGEARERVWVGVEDALWCYHRPSRTWRQLTPPQPSDPPPLGQWRYAAVSHLLLGRHGDIWVTFLMCGAASCDTLTFYHVRNGDWTEIPLPGPVTPVLDETGTPWLFTCRAVFRVVGDKPDLVDDLQDIRSVTRDATGRTWFLARHEGSDWLWTVREDGGG